MLRAACFALFAALASTGCDEGVSIAPAALAHEALLPIASAPEAEAPPAAAATRAAPSGPARLAFVGDVALAFDVAHTMASGDAPPGYPFQHVAERLRGYDLAVGNLECVVSTTGLPRVPNPLTAPPSAPSVLLEAGFDVVSIANNHSLDRSRTGYLETRRRLDDAGLAHVGTTFVDFDRDPWIVRDVQGVKIAVIGHYNRDPALAVRDVERARREADVVIAFVHWGNEFDRSPVREQRRMGQRLVDAGAHAVVGAHAHLVQPLETYRDRPIVHGLGNFVFSGMTRAGTRTGALVELDVTPEGVADVRFVRVAIDGGGVPRFEGEPTPNPAFDPDEPRPLPPLGSESPRR